MKMVQNYLEIKSPETGQHIYDFQLQIFPIGYLEDAIAVQLTMNALSNN